MRKKLAECKLLLDNDISNASNGNNHETASGIVKLKQLREEYTFLPSVHTNLKSVLQFCEHPAMLMSNSKEVMHFAKKLQRFNKYFPRVCTSLPNSNINDSSIVNGVLGRMQNLLYIATEYENQINYEWRIKAKDGDILEWKVFVKSYLHQKQILHSLEKRYAGCLCELFDSINAINDSGSTDENMLLKLEWSNINK